ncbi:MAG: extracellular solute-binding protein [Alphaproteobacteria bacterium]
MFLWTSAAFATPSKVFSYVNPKAPKGGSVHLHTLKKFDSFFPYGIQGTAADGSDLLFATLMKTPITNLDESFPYVALKALPSTDFSEVTFTLNPNATFSDDSPITAEDVKFSFNLIQSKTSTYKLIFQNVKSVTVLAPDKIKFSFYTPSKSFVQTLGTLPVFSHADYKRNFSESKPFFVPLSSGPYAVSKFQRPTFVAYKRLENWWGQNLPVTQGFYNFDKVHYTYYANVQTAFEAFKKGQLDLWIDQRISSWIQNYDFPAVLQKKIKRIEFEKVYPHGLAALFFNTRKWPYDDARVRKALTVLFDFDQINKTYFHNQYVRLTSIFTNSPYGGPTFSDTAFCPMKAQQKLTPRDRKKCALALLRKAGFVFDSDTDTLLHKKGPLTLNLVVFSQNYGKLYQNYIKTLKNIGIDASIFVGNTQSYSDKYENFDFDLILHYHPHLLNPGEEQTTFWSSKTYKDPGTLNIAGVHDPKVDDLVDKIAAMPPKNLLKQYAHQLDKIILSSAYIIPLWAPKHVNVAFWSKFKYPEFSKDSPMDFLDHPICKQVDLLKTRKNAARYKYTTWWMAP